MHPVVWECSQSPTLWLLLSAGAEELQEASRLPTRAVNLDTYHVWGGWSGGCPVSRMLLPSQSLLEIQPMMWPMPTTTNPHTVVSANPSHHTQSGVLSPTSFPLVRGQELMGWGSCRSAECERMLNCVNQLVGTERNIARMLNTQLGIPIRNYHVLTIETFKVEMFYCLCPMDSVAV